MQSLKEEILIIQKLTQNETYNSYWIYHASLIEEIGELAQALKVEYNFIKHKELKESAASECADVFVCCFMAFFGNGGKLEDIRTVSTLQHHTVTKNIFELLAILSDAANAPVRFHNKYDIEFHLLYAASLAYEIYKQCGGIEQQFSEIVNKKLNKWDVNQKNRLAL